MAIALRAFGGPSAAHQLPRRLAGRYDRGRWNVDLAGGDSGIQYERESE